MCATICGQAVLWSDYDVEKQPDSSMRAVAMPHDPGEAIRHHCQSLSSLRPSQSFDDRNLLSTRMSTIRINRALGTCGPPKVKGPGVKCSGVPFGVAAWTQAVRRGTTRTSARRTQQFRVAAKFKVDSGNGNCTRGGFAALH